MRKLKHSIVNTPFADISLADTDGTGAPLVFLHGSGSSKEVFAKQFADPAFLNRRIVALDLPGHGQSSNAFDKTSYTFAGIAGALCAALAEIGVANPVLAGWSLGGHVAIEMAASGFQTRGIAMFGTPPLPRGPFGFLRGFQPRFNMLLTAKSHFTEDEAVRFAKLVIGDSVDESSLASIRRADGASRVQVAHSMFRGEGCDQRRFVETTCIPIAFINGADDPLLKLKYLLDIDVPALWRQTCQTIDKAGHACFRDQPEAFNTLLSAFLADIDSSPLQLNRPETRVAA
jgi:pimeloyl-ACP methyl ester carboxylesterase